MQDGGPADEQPKLSHYEQVQARRAAKKAAAAAAEAEKQRLAAETLAIEQAAAAWALEEKRRARNLLGLEGYWRPATVFNSDARYSEDFEMIVSVSADRAVQDYAVWDESALCYQNPPWLRPDGTLEPELAAQSTRSGRYSSSNSSVASSTNNSFDNGDDGDNSAATTAVGALSKLKFSRHGFWWIGCTLHDADGEKCYTYARLDRQPRGAFVERWDPASHQMVQEEGGVQLAVFVDLAQRARLKLRLQLKHWGKLLGFRAHCFALVTVAKALKEAQAKADGDRRLALEVARLDREQAAKLRQPSAVSSDLLPGFELGAVKELARLVLQLRYGHVTSASPPSTTIPSGSAPSSSPQLQGTNVPMPRHGGASVLGPGLESALPPQREPAVLDAVDEARFLPLHPLSSHLVHGQPSSSGQGATSANSPPTTTTGVPHNAETDLRSAGWDLQQLLLAFPELAGALKVALGSSATPSNKNMNTPSSNSSNSSIAFEEKVDPFVGGRAGTQAGASLLATNVPLPPSLQQSHRRHDGGKIAKPVNNTTNQRSTVAGPVVDGTVKAMNNQGQYRRRNRLSHDSQLLCKSGEDSSSSSDDDGYNFVADEDEKANEEGTTSKLSSNGNSIDWGSSSEEDGDNKEEVKKSEARTSKSRDEDEEENDEAEDEVAALGKKNNDKKSPLDEATTANNEYPRAPSTASPALKLPPTVAPLPFMAEDFPVGECTLYGCGDNACEQVADLDQVLGANLVNLRITEAEKARLAREAAKELKVERGEEASDSEEELAEALDEEEEEFGSEQVETSRNASDVESESSDVTSTNDVINDVSHRLKKKTPPASGTCTPVLRSPPGTPGTPSGGHLLLSRGSSTSPSRRGSAHSSRNGHGGGGGGGGSYRGGGSKDGVGSAPSMLKRRPSSIMERQSAEAQRPAFSPALVVRAPPLSPSSGSSQGGLQPINGSNHGSNHDAVEQLAPSYSSEARREDKELEFERAHLASREVLRPLVPTRTATVGDKKEHFDVVAWKSRLLVKQAGKEANNWYKLIRPQGRPSYPFPNDHPDYPFSHQRERIVSASVGTSCSAVITRQGRLYTWGDNAAGQLGRREDIAKTSSIRDNADVGTVPATAKSNHQPPTPKFPTSPPMSPPSSQRPMQQQQQQQQSRSVSPGALYVDAHAPRNFSPSSCGSTRGAIGDVDGDAIGTSRFRTAGGQALALLISQSEFNDDEDDIGDNLGALFHASPWQALTEGIGEEGKGRGQLLAMPAARFERKYSSLAHRSSGGSRPLLEDDDDDDDDEEDANPALDFMGHDGGGAPLRASFGRVLCSLGPHQRVVIVACGGAHTLLATSLGRLYSFGSNVRGQLGLDDRDFKGNSYESNKDRGTASSPQLVVALQHQYVVWCGAGSAFSACITIEPVASGTPGVALNTSAVRQQIHTCGANDQGQLGLGGTFTEEVTPARMLNKPATGGLDPNGYDTTRGNTSVGTFRPINLQPPAVATMMKGLKQRNDLAKLMSMRAAAASNASMSSFKEGEKNGQGSGIDLPPFEGGAEPRTMSCGAAHCAVITMDGRLITWGANEFGQLGRGFFSPHHGTTLSPTKMAAELKAAGREGPRATALAAARANDDDGGAQSMAAAQVEKRQSKIVATHLEKQAEEARLLLAQEEAEKANRRRARAAAGEGEESDEDSDEEAFRASLKKKLIGGIKKTMFVSAFGAEARAVDAANAKKLTAWQNTSRPAVVEFPDVVLARDGDSSKGTSGGGQEAAAKMVCVSVACGGDHTIIARADRCVLSTGRNHKGQLGLGQLSLSELRALGIPKEPKVDQTHTFRFVPALRGIGTRLVAAGLHHSMAITATEHVYVWGGLTAKKDPLKVSHRPSVVPLLSGRQPQVSTGNGCAHHALVTTFDVLGPLLIVFDEPASRELIVRKKVFDAVLKEAEKASTLLDQNDDSRNDDKDKDGKDDDAEKAGGEINNDTGSVASSSSSSSSSFANRLSGAPPPPLPLDKQHAHYLLDWRWVGRAVADGRWSSNGSQLWKDPACWDATHRPPPNDPTLGVQHQQPKYRPQEDAVPLPSSSITHHGNKNNNSSFVDDNNNIDNNNDDEEDLLSPLSPPFTPKNGESTTRGGAVAASSMEEAATLAYDRRLASSGSVRLVFTAAMQTHILALVKAQLADPRLHDLESTEERASDALQRAQAKPHKLEQAQKVMAALAPAQRERKRLQRTAECLKDGFVWDGPKMPKTPKYGFSSFMDSPLDPSPTCADDDPRASALGHFQRINTPSTRNHPSSAGGGGGGARGGRNMGTFSSPSSSRPSSSQHEPLSPLSPDTLSSSSSSAAGAAFSSKDFAPTTSPSSRWADAVLSSNDEAMHDAALNDGRLQAFTEAALEVLRSAGVNDPRWTAANVKPKQRRASTSSIASPPSTPPSPLSPLSPMSPLSPSSADLRSPTSPSFDGGGAFRASTRGSIGNSSAQKRALEKQAAENKRALRTATADGSAVGGALLWASLAHAPRRVLMVSSSPPDPALTAAAAANGTTGAAAAAAAAASQEEDQEEEDDEGAQRVAAYKKLGLGACTVSDLETALAAIIEITPGEKVPDDVELGDNDDVDANGGGSPDKKTPSRQNSISPSRQNSMSPSRNRLSRNSSSAMMDPSSSSSQRRNSRSPSPGGLRRDQSHQSSRVLGSNDRHHSTSGGIGGGGGGGSRDGSRGGGGSGSSSMRRRSSGVGDLKRRPSSTTMGVMGNGRGWERMSRQASRPSFSVAGSETGSTIGSPLVDPTVALSEVAMISSSALRKQLALVGAWTGANGRALPLPPHLPPVLAKATEGLRHRTTTGGGGVSSSSSSGDSAGNDEGAGGEDESSRDRKEDRVSNQELQTTSPGRAIVKASSSPSTAIASKSGDASKTKAEHLPMPSPHVGSILPSLINGQSWFNKEEDAIAALNAVTPQVEEWRSRQHEDGLPVPSLVEELVEKNGLTAALNFGWWHFASAFLLLVAPVPRWHALVASQLATARVRLHHDLSPSKVTKGSTGSKSKEAPFKSKDRESATNIQQTSRAGGFLCPPTAELSALFNQGSATDEPHTNIYDHSHHHALEASPHRDLGKNRSQSRSGGIVPKSNIGSNDNEYNNNGVGNNPAEMLGDGALTSGVASPGCCCGTCTSCTLLKARRVPRQLMAKGNDALGGVGSKQLNQLERDTQRAQDTTHFALAAAEAASVIRKENPQWSDDKVRHAVLQNGGPELMAFHRQDPQTFYAFTDRKAQPPPK